jgi:preprotein translocase subunit SecA
MARQDKEDFIYKTTREKFNAVIEDVTELSKARPCYWYNPVEISELFVCLKWRRYTQCIEC